jgi:glycosyltransferase involved in cell wall biosynthesis
MKIGIVAPFYPAVGGTEAIARHLAEGFHERGHDVTVITPTPGLAGDETASEYRVIRRPGAWHLLAEMRRLDGAVILGVMLRTLWAAALATTPVVISHQTWLERSNGRLRLLGWCKWQCTAFCGNIVASPALLTETVGPTVIVPNCYDDRVFTFTNRAVRPKELIFVGRFVPDKGVDLLLEAMAMLRDSGVRPQLTLIGDGPERVKLERMTDELGLRQQVVFGGRQPPPIVAGLLNQHKILVVPSRWAEPFGIVALEGIACGCAVVASAGGGLGDLVGPFGRVFPRNDPAGLYSALHAELARAQPDGSGPDRLAYLGKFQPATLIDGYLAALTRRVNRRT